MFFPFANIVGYLTPPPKDCRTEGCLTGECVRQGYDFVCRHGKCFFLNNFLNIIQIPNEFEVIRLSVKITECMS